MTNADCPPVPEFSRLVEVDAILHSGRIERSIRADGEELDRLAARLGIGRLHRLEATAAVSVSGQGRFLTVEGRITAAMERACVVTLEPFETTMEEPFRVVFDRAPEKSADEIAIDLDADAPDAPEPLEGRAIDLGELAAQQLALTIDPFPRAPGADLAEELGSVSGSVTLNDTRSIEEWVAGEAPENHPFAALARLKPGSSEG